MIDFPAFSYAITEDETKVIQFSWYNHKEEDFTEYVEMYCVGFIAVQFGLIARVRASTRYNPKGRWLNITFYGLIVENEITKI